MDIEAMKSFNEEQMLEFLHENSEHIVSADQFLAELESPLTDKELELCQQHKSNFYDWYDSDDKKEILAPIDAESHDENYEVDDTVIDEIVFNADCELKLELRFEPQVFVHDDNTAEVIPFMYDELNEKYITASELDEIVAEKQPEMVTVGYTNGADITYSFEYQKASDVIFDKLQDLINQEAEKNIEIKKQNEKQGIEQ